MFQIRGGCGSLEDYDLWRENPYDEVREYRLLIVTYGTISAPYLAIAGATGQ